MASRTPVATFFVRVWRDDGSFRARVSRCTDIDTEPAVELLAASPEKLAEHFVTWLREVGREDS